MSSQDDSHNDETPGEYITVKVRGGATRRVFLPAEGYTDHLGRTRSMILGALEDDSRAGRI